jgi:hypothetical protein
MPTTGRVRGTSLIIHLECEAEFGKMSRLGGKHAFVLELVLYGFVQGSKNKKTVSPSQKRPTHLGAFVVKLTPTLLSPSEPNIDSLFITTAYRI